MDWTERFNEGTGTYTYTSTVFPGYEITWTVATPLFYLVHSPVGPIGKRRLFANAEALVIEDSALVGHATQLKLGD